MKITCQACGAKYTIADDKVRGRKVKIRCKGCSAPIVVDAQAEASGAPVDASKEPEADAGIELTSATETGAVEGWSVNLSDTEQRQMTTEEIVAGFKSGVVTADAFVWKDGMGDWVPVLESELAPLLSAGAPATAAVAAPAAAAAIPIAATPSPFAAAKPAASATPARRAAGNAGGAVDLFGSVENAGSEDEVATSAPGVGHVRPDLPAYEDKATGARNENSVLFSLDALKAGVQNEPKKPAAPPPRRGGPPAPSAASDPFGLGGASDIMNIGGGNPLFSLGSNQALLTAPAAPEPPPQRSMDVALASPLSTGPSEKKSKLPLIAGGALLVAILIGAVIVFGGKKSEGSSGAASSAEASATEAATAKPEEAKTEPKKEEPKPEASAAASTAPAASETKPAASAAAASTSKPGTTTTTTTKPPEEPAAASSQPFNKSAAIAALTSASNSAQGCKKAGGPTGVGKVSVTFAPSGRVTTANVMGPPFAGTPVGGCVASLFRRSKIPAFGPDPVTVAKSFMIN